MNTIEEVETFLGRFLTAVERTIYDLVCDDANYEFFIDENGNMGARRKPRINLYTCPNRHALVTIDRDKGTTPMFIACIACGAQATSAMYRVPSDLTPTHEWFIPNAEEIEAEIQNVISRSAGAKMPNYFQWVKSIRDGYAEHVKSGGLLLRKIKNG